MDLVGYSRERASTRSAASIPQYLDGLRRRRHDFVIPVSARDGDNIVDAAPRRMPWYDGPTVMEALDGLPAGTRGRSSCRCACRSRTSTSSTTGASSSGASRAAVLAVGDRLLFSPSEQDGACRTASKAGARRGAASRRRRGNPSASRSTSRSSSSAASSRASRRPPIETNVFRGRLFWLGHEPLRLGDEYRLKLATREVAGHGAGDRARLSTPTDLAVRRGQRGAAPRQSPRSSCAAARMLALDECGAWPAPGRFVADRRA